MSSQRRRFIVSGVLSAAGLAVSMPTRAANADRTIGLVLKSLPDPFTKTMILAAQAFQKHYPEPFQLAVDGISSETDADGQVRIVKAMIERGVNAIVLAPADSRALIPIAAECVKRGIVTLTIDNPLDAQALEAADVRVPFVGPDNRRGARLVAAYLARKLRPGDRVGVIEGVTASRNARQRTDGSTDEMQAAQMKIVAVQSGDWDYGKGRLAALGILAQTPDLRALLCGNDNMAMGAVDAIRQTGRTGKVLVTGYNNSDAIRPLLKNGSVLATVDQFAAKQAVYGLDVALQALLRHSRQDDLSAFIETPVMLVTREKPGAR